MRRLWLACLLLSLWTSVAQAFQTAPLVEGCNRTANPLGSGWVGAYDPDALGAITANGTVCVGAAANASTYWGTSLGRHAVITATCSDCTTTSTNGIHLIPWLVEPSSSSNTVENYRCVWQPAASVLQISKVTNGAVGVQLPGSPATVTISTGDQLGCQKVGATISAWIDQGSGWQLVLSTTDPSPFSTVDDPGFVGLLLTSTTLSVDQIGFGRVQSAPLGLHHTADEVALWQTRMTTMATEWAYILANADTWVAAPEARWTGQTTNACWSTANQPNRRLDDGMLDAAFVYLLTGDTDYLTPVVTELLEQTTIPGTDFSNTVRWCADGSPSSEATNISPWLTRLAHAYSYVRSAMSVTDQTTMESWFLAAGIFMDDMIQSLAVKRFANRLSDDYTDCNQSGFCPGSVRGITHFGGPTVNSFHEGWSNQLNSMNVLVATVGALTGNSLLLTNAKRTWKEWLKYATFPGGQVIDQYRWTPGCCGGTDETPGHAYHYSSLSIGSAINVADTLARLGDFELYDYTTSDGMFGSEGGPKSLLLVAQHFAGMTNGTVTEYASTTGATDPNVIIDSEDESTDQRRNEFNNLARSNLWFNDAAIKTAYSHAWYADGVTSGYDDEKGEWGLYPHMLFMFGDLEGLVDPYALLAGLYIDNLNACPGTGSAADPFCSVQGSLDHAIPNDVIRIRSGTGIYDEYATTTARQGTAVAPITIQPDTGAVLVLRNCDPGAAKAALEILDSDYWIIQGLTFDASGCATAPSRYALRLQGLTRDITGVQVLNNTFQTWRQTTGATQGPEALRLGGCETALGCAGTVHAITPVVQGNLFDSIDLTAMHLIRTQGALVADNTITAMRCGRQGSGGPAETIGIHYTHSNTTLTLRSNTISDFTSYLSCPLTSQGVATVAGIWCDTGGGADSDNVIERTVIHDLDAGKADLANAAGTSHSASGIFLEEQCAGTLVKNNVLYNIGTYGIRNEYHATGGTTDTANEYYHNSVYDMLEPLYFKEGVAIVKNNLVAVCRGVCIKNDDDSDNTLTIDGNLYSDGGTQTKIGQINPGSPLVFTAWQSACSCDATSKNADPQLAVVP